MKLSYFSRDKLKSIIMDGIIKYRNGIYPNSQFNHEKVSVGYEIMTYTRKNLTTNQQKKVDKIYDEIVKSLV